eukprot:14307777-Alexandrium_andersonii.AAC.1
MPSNQQLHLAINAQSRPSARVQGEADRPTGSGFSNGHHCHSRGRAQPSGISNLNRGPTIKTPITIPSKQIVNKLPVALGAGPHQPQRFQPQKQHVPLRVRVAPAPA